jgi:PAS domain S-box-containing protein
VPGSAIPAAPDATRTQFEQELRTSIDRSPLPALLTDPGLPDNPIVAVNRAFCRLTGYGPEEILGRNCRLLAGPGSESEAQDELRHAILEGRPALVEITNYRKDGTAFLNNVMIAPALDESGRIAYFVGSQMDAGPERLVANTRRREAARAVRALTKRQREILRQVILGFRNKQIANSLGITEKTVKMHRAAVLRRLGAGSSAEAVRIGVEAGLGVGDLDR